MKRATRAPIRVLVADDSPSSRLAIREILDSGGGIEIVGEARSGREALELTARLLPDVVTMDLDMPGLDGFETTHEIMVTSPTPIVIVSAMSHVSEAEAAARALGVGALAVLQKPPSPRSPGYAAAARELCETVKAMAEVKVVRRVRARPRPAPPPAAALGHGPLRVVAIGASTGGPQALEALLRALPPDFSVPILVVQHIATGFTAGLASWLARATGRRVKVAEAGEPLRGDTVLVAPDGRHLGAVRSGVALVSEDPPVGGFRPSASFLFASVAEAYGASAAGVILTGMGRDGVEGLRALRRSGGRILAQDEESSVVFGMPGAAVAEGLASAVLPVEGIAARLAVDARRSATTSAGPGDGGDS